METKSVRISNTYHKEIKRYIAEKGYDGENISSFINVAIFKELTHKGHRFQKLEKQLSKPKK